jgi:restriction system protein
MAVPEFQSMMLPMLKFLSDGQEHVAREVEDSLVAQMGLTDEDRNELLPSGRGLRLRNRIAWAKAHLKAAGLLESTRHGHFQISPLGLEALKQNPSEITLKYLDQFPGHLAFHSKPNQEALPNPAPKESEVRSPIETLETSYQELRLNLAMELLEKVKSCSPRFFENLVVDLLVAMGYGGSRKDAGQAVGQSGDGGIDGIIKEDKLGLDAVYIQAKRWENTVGRPVVQAFAGSLEGQRARKGVFITTSQFSSDAKAYVDRIEKRIVLIDGEHLAQLMIEHGVGVAEVATYTVKRMDLDYFGDE